MSVNERIKIILSTHKLTASEFADELGIQRSAVSHLLSGRNKPSLDMLEKILNHFPRVNAHWLVTGVTPKQPGVTDVTSVTQDESTTSGIERIVIFYKDKSFKAYTDQA